MSMGFESMLQSTPTGSDIALEMGDIKLQYNAALDDLRVVSASFESYMNACERYLALCDCVEANEGMLEPAVRDFVNRNGELSMALGIDLAMEDDSQDAQKENGNKVNEKKQGFLRRMWEGIKAFIKKILDGIGNFFHWLGSFLSPKEEKLNTVVANAETVSQKLENDVKAKHASGKEAYETYVEDKSFKIYNQPFKGFTALFDSIAGFINEEVEDATKDNSSEYAEWAKSQDGFLCEFAENGSLWSRVQPLIKCGAIRLENYPHQTLDGKTINIKMPKSNIDSEKLDMFGIAWVTNQWYSVEACKTCIDLHRKIKQTGELLNDNYHKLSNYYVAIGRKMDNDWLPKLSGAAAGKDFKGMNVAGRSAVVIYKELLSTYGRLVSQYDQWTKHVIATKEGLTR